MENSVTRAQAIHALPPDADPTALAPADTETAEPDFAKLVEDQDFAKFLNRIADYATRRSNTPEQWERRRKTVKLRKYILGEYFGIFDREFGWVSRKDEGDGIYFDPQTATFVDSIVSQLVKSRPKKEFRARAAERAEKREAARVAEKLIEIDELDDLNPKRQQREWKWNLIAAGETYRITYFNAQKTGRGFIRDVYEQKTIEGGERAMHCPLCSSVTADEDGKCAGCGNPQMDAFEASGATIAMHRGQRYEQVGDVDWDSPDALEMTVIGDTDSVAEALIVMRERMIPRCVLEDALDTEGLPSTGAAENLSYKQMFEGRGDDGGGKDTREFEPLHYQEFWLAPAVCRYAKVPAGTRLRNGRTTGGEARLKDLAPNGFYFSRVGKRITLGYPQAAGECLAHTVNSIGEGFHGHGEWDLAELQDQATEAKSMKMNSMLLDSTTPLLVNKRFIDTEEFENKFGLVIAVEDLPEGMLPEQTMGRLKPAAPPAEAYQIGQEIKGEMQQRIGAFSTQSDAPDIKAMGTATGIAAITEQTLGRRGPALQLYAFMEIEQAYQKLELRQKYWPAKMYDPVAKELGPDAVRWFRECNIRQDIAISVVQDSWMPRLDSQKQTNLQAMLALTGSIIAAKGDPKMLDEVIRKANEVFGGGLNFGDLETESAEARLRLDKLKEIGEFTEEQFGPMAYDPGGAANPEAMRLAYSQAAELLRLVHIPIEATPGDIFYDLPLDVMFDEHAEFEEAYTDWLRSAEGRGASVFVRSLVHKLAEYHIQAEAWRTTRLKALAMITETPDLEAELIANDAMQGQELEHREEDQEQQMRHLAVQEMLAPPGEGPRDGGKTGR